MSSQSYVVVLDVPQVNYERGELLILLCIGTVCPGGETTLLTLRADVNGDIVPLERCYDGL